MESNQGYGQVPGFIDVPFEERKPLSEYLYAILYRKWMVIALVALGTGIGAFYAYYATPLYRSRAIVEIEKVFPTSANLNDLFSFFGQFDLYYQTQIESLQSRSLAAEFVKRMNAPRSAEGENMKDSAPAAPSSADSSAIDPSKAHPESKAGDAQERETDAAVNAVLSRISVSPIKGTQLIQVEMGHQIPCLRRRRSDLH
jgi:uncharacterized protein involved in exopolysaccharide biosynthesis